MGKLSRRAVRTVLQFPLLCPNQLHFLPLAQLTGSDAATDSPDLFSFAEGVFLASPAFVGVFAAAVRAAWRHEGRYRSDLVERE